MTSPSTEHTLASSKHVVHVPSKDKPPSPGVKPSRSTRRSRTKHMGHAAVKYFSLQRGSHNRSGTAPGTSNQTAALYGNTSFMKKSGMLSDLLDHPVKQQPQHSFTTVIVIASVFLFVTVTIVTAIVVFCRKKNSVFALQKCEQEDDGEYELDELHTDVEYTETDAESECENPVTSRRTRRQSYPQDSHDTAYRLLGPTCHHHHDPFYQHCQHHRYHRHVCHCPPHTADKGHYQKVVVAAVLEKPHGDASDCDYDSDSSGEPGGVPQAKRSHQVRRHRTASRHPHDSQSDLESDQELLTTATRRHKHRKHMVKKTSKCPHVQDTDQHKGYGTNLNNNCSAPGNKRKGAYLKVASEDSTNCDNKCGKKKGSDSVDRCKRRPCDCKSCSLYVELPSKDSKDNDIHELPVASYHSAMHDQCIIDLHPDLSSHVTRPAVLPGGTATGTTTVHMDCDVDGWRTASPELVTYRGAAVRSQSASDSLSELAVFPGCVNPDPGAQSCPQTPLGDELSASDIQNDPMVFYSHAAFKPTSLYDTSLEYRSPSQSASRTSVVGRSFRAQTASNPSVDTDTGVAFVLYQPHSSVLSLARDYYENPASVDPVCEEAGGHQGARPRTTSVFHHPIQATSGSVAVTDELQGDDQSRVQENIPSDYTDRRPSRHLACASPNVNDSTHLTPHLDTDRLTNQSANTLNANPDSPSASRQCHGPSVDKNHTS